MKRIYVWSFLLLVLAMVVPRLTGLAAPLMGGFTVERVSIGDDESEGNDRSSTASVTTGGVFIAFDSDADNLVPNDTNAVRDVFVRSISSSATQRVSVSSTGVEGDDGSYGADISASGQYVIFTSTSTNLVAGDTNSTADVFLRDRTLSTTILISDDSTGGPAGGWSHDPKISPDGGAAVFSSIAFDLVAGDTNGVYDCFFQNLETGARARAMTTTGDELNADCEHPDVSDGVRHMVFVSEATNIVPGDTNGERDVFVVSTNNASPRRVSVSSTGEEANDFSHQPSLSDSGIFIAFTSNASNLVPDDTNNAGDVFVRNMLTGTTRRVSVASDGSQGNGQSIMPFISEDGRFVLFSSTAINFPGSTPGHYQVYIHDRVTGLTELVSKDNNGVSGDESALHASLSENHQMVVFESAATNLVSGDTNELNDVFRSDIGEFPPPTPTATTTPPPSATATGTLVPTLTPTLDLTEFPPTATPTGTLTPPTSTPSLTPTLDPTEFPATPTPTGTLTPVPGTATPTVDPTEFPVTQTPTPDGTVTPSTPTPIGTVLPLDHQLYLPLIQGT